MVEHLDINLLSRQDLEKDFWAIISQRVSQYSQNIIVKSTSTTLTYFDFNQRANHLAVEIARKNGERQCGVALFMTDGGKLSSAVVGVLKSKHYIVSLDPTFPTFHLEYMLKDSQTGLIVTDNIHYHKALSLTARPDVVINMDTLSYDKELPDPVVSISPDDIVLLIYTSGTTGEPKGVVIDYRYLCRAINHQITSGQVKIGDHIGNLTSFSFGSPYTYLFACLINGATFYHYHLKSEGLSGVRDWLKREKISYFPTKPAIFRMFHSALDPDEQFPDVKLFSLGAEKKLKQDLIGFRKHFSPECKMVVKFVATETFVVSYRIFEHDYDFIDEVLPAGYPLDDIDLYIRDLEGNEVPRGEIGEIVVRGDALARGYWNKPELTKEKFIKDPTDPAKTIFYTGDLGRILSDGQLQHMGRLDDLVKNKGVRIELSSIENHILAYPGIVQAAAKTFENDQKDMKLVAYFVPQDSVTIAKSDLRKFLADRLPLQMMPNYLVCLDSIPMTETFKINRKALPIPDLTRPALENPCIPAQNGLEAELVKIWEKNIGIQGIGVTDDYFELGGDSLTGVLLFVQIEQVFKKRLPVSVLLTHPTIRQLIDVLQQVDINKTWSPILPLKSQGDGAPVFFIPGKGGFPIRFKYLAEKICSDNPLYAMQSWGVGKGRQPFYTIEEMASHFIKEIKKITPHGPYHLCGESGGGMVAFEMAQQLREIGEQVPIMVMLDTYGPGQPGLLELPRTTKTRLAHRFILVKKHLQIILKSNWEGRRAYFRYYKQLISSKKNAYLQNIQLSKQTRMTPRLPTELKQVEQAHIIASHNYQPKSYPDRVILFRSQRNPISVDQTNGWGNVDIGELIVHNLDCYHGNILFDPAVSQVAELMVKYLFAYHQM